MGFSAPVDALLGVVTPLKWSSWASMIQAYPDRCYVGYLLDGIAHGFRIGLNIAVKVSSARKNNYAVCQ